MTAFSFQGCGVEGSVRDYVGYWHFAADTVRHAYDELQQAGAIVILPARGTYVAEQPPKADPVEHADRLESFAQQVIASATAAGLDAGAVARCIAQVTMKKEAKS